MTVARLEIEAEGIEKLDEHEQALVLDYFRRFADTRQEGGDVLCPNCGKTLYGIGGVLKQALGLYTFTWGIVYGEGYCSADGCGWPARGYPSITIGERVVRFPIPLPYHPEEVTTRGRSD